jgi:hypothetical protein
MLCYTMLCISCIIFIHQAFGDDQLCTMHHTQAGKPSSVAGPGAPRQIHCQSSCMYPSFFSVVTMSTIPYEAQGSDSSDSLAPALFQKVGTDVVFGPDELAHLRQLIKEDKAVRRTLTAAQWEALFEVSGFDMCVFLDHMWDIRRAIFAADLSQWAREGTLAHWAELASHCFLSSSYFTSMCEFCLVRESVAAWLISLRCLPGFVAARAVYLRSSYSHRDEAGWSLPPNSATADCSYCVLSLRDVMLCCKAVCGASRTAGAGAGDGDGDGDGADLLPVVSAVLLEALLLNLSIHTRARRIRIPEVHSTTHSTAHSTAPTEKSSWVLSESWRGKFLGTMARAGENSLALFLSLESEAASAHNPTPAPTAAPIPVPTLVPVPDPIGGLEADPYLALWGRGSHWLCSAGARRRALLQAVRSIQRGIAPRRPPRADAGMRYEGIVE